MNYPGNYPDSVNCKYLISLFPKPGYYVNINFKDFRIQYSHNCTDDMVSISDGIAANAPLLGNYCGTTKPPSLRSSGSKLLVVLRSNAMVNSKGFQLSYQPGTHFFL